jgi:two-component system KDP operon response regulator KdpE
MTMEMSRRALVIMSEVALAHALRLTLEGAGYVVLLAGDAVDGLRRLREGLPEVIVLDAALPDGDGIDLLPTIREISHVPVLLLLMTVTSPAVIRALDLGADDCAARSLPPAELTARVRALIRRAEMPPLLPRTSLVIDDWLTIDFSRAQVLAGGRAVALRPTEFRLLYHLVSHPGRVLTYESLLARVWGSEYRQETHYVRLYVGYLRAKLEPDPHRPRYILTQRGLGYRFVDYRQTAEGGTAAAGES